MAEDDVDELAAAILVGLAVNWRDDQTLDDLVSDAYELAEAFAKARRERRRGDVQRDG